MGEFGGQLFYPDPVQRGRTCSRLNRNHPLPDGNKRTAFEAMREQLDREGIIWQPTATVPEIVDAVEMLAARCVTEEDFIAWVSLQVKVARAEMTRFAHLTHFLRPATMGHFRWRLLGRVLRLVLSALAEGLRNGPRAGAGFHAVRSI